MLGGAILLISCEQSQPTLSDNQKETLMTEKARDLTVVESENGLRAYRVNTSLLEGYSIAKEPYREFREGVFLETFKKDTASTKEMTLTANYAINFINRDLWEVKGNVVVTLSDNTTLYTQQLFWDRRADKIYSNVDTKIVNKDGAQYGEGFESPASPPYLWRFRRYTGALSVDVTPTSGADSTHRSNPYETSERDLEPTVPTNRESAATQPKSRSTRRDTKTNKREEKQVFTLEADVMEVQSWD